MQSSRNKTHTHTKERGVLYQPRRAASPWLSLCPGPGRPWLPFRNSTLSPTVSSFLSREQLCFCLPAATSGKCYARVSAVRAGRLACAFPPPACSLLPPCPPLPSSFELPSPEGCGAEFCPPRLFGEFGGSFCSCGEDGGEGRFQGPPRVDVCRQELLRAGMLCCGPRLCCLPGSRGERCDVNPPLHTLCGDSLRGVFGSWPCFWAGKTCHPWACDAAGCGAASAKCRGLKKGARGDETCVIPPVLLEGVWGGARCAESCGCSCS